MKLRFTEKRTSIRMSALVMTFSLLATGMCKAEESISNCIFPADQWNRSNLTPNIMTESALGISNQSALRQMYSADLRNIVRMSFEPIPQDILNRFNKINSGVVRVDLWLKHEEKQCIAICTGWLASYDKVVTAGHCIGSPPFLPYKAAALFGYQGGNVGVFRELDPKPVESEPSSGLDYAIFKLKEPAPTGTRPLRVSKKPVRSAHSLALIGHPWGIPKQLVRSKCYAASMYPIQDKFYLRHTCDTLPGMSGAPIFDESTGDVVAIHKAGGRLDEYNLNFGVAISEIKKISAYIGNEIADIPNKAVEISRDLKSSPNDVGSLSPIVIPVSFATTLSTYKSVANTDVDAIINDLNSIIKSQSFNCPMRFTKQGDLISILQNQSSGDVTSNADFQTLIRLPGLVKFVGEINWCGQPGTGVLECSPMGGSSTLISSVMKSNTSKVILHGFGHLAGLSHEHNDPTNFMQFIVGENTSTISKPQCLALYNKFKSEIISSNNAGDN